LSATSRPDSCNTLKAPIISSVDEFPKTIGREICNQRGQHIDPGIDDDTASSLALR